MTQNKKSFNFGRKLRLLRNKRKMTQEVFCELVGVEPRTLYRWEHGLSYPRTIYRAFIQEVMPEIGKV